MISMLPARIKTLRGWHEETGEMNQEAFFATTDFITKKVSLPRTIRNMLRAVDEIVTEHDAERLVTHRRAGREHRVPEAQGLLLADAHDAGEPGERPQRIGVTGLAASAKGVLELVRNVEVVLDGRLLATVHDDDVRESGAHRLLDDELEGRDVDDGEHLLRHRLGGGQKARPEAGGGDDELADLLEHGASGQSVAG
jgi:hypothetical protein